MKLVKEITVVVDLDEERKRIDSIYKGKPLYNKGERKFLHTIVDLFEQCKFDECIKILRENKKQDWNEYLNTTIGNVLWGIANRDEVYKEITN